MGNVAATKRQRAAVYTRLSRDRDSSTSIERQLADGRQLCKARGYEIVHESAIDVDVSGKRLSRPGLDEVRRLMPELDVIVFWKVDRLSRSLRDFLELVHEAEQHDVALVSCTEPLDLSTPVGKAMTSIMATFAELERRVIGQRTKSSIRHLKQIGRVSGGPIPYGYKAIPATDGPGYIRTIDDKQAVVVIEMVDSVLAGESYRAICRRMNERQIPTPRGRSSMWRPNAIRAIIRNPVLWGATVHQGQVVRRDDGMPILGAAIISRDTWDTVQTEMERRGKPSERNGSLRQGLLSGLLICDHCGTRLGMNRGGPKTRERVYTCPTKGHGGKCVGVAVTAARVEEYVTARFLEKYGTWSMPLPVFFEEPAETRPEPEELRAVETAMADLETDRYERGLFQGESGATRFAEMYRRLEARRGALLSEMSADGPSSGDGGNFEILPTTMGEYWATAAPEDQRLLLRGLLGSIRVKKGTPGRKGLDPRRIGFERGLTGLGQDAPEDPS